MLVPEVFRDNHNIQKIKIGSIGKCSQVCWWSRHNLLREQKEAILKLDGPSDVHWVSGFRPRNADEFIDCLKFTIDLFDQVYVVGPGSWLCQAMVQGLKFRSFCCYRDFYGISFKCVHQYQLLTRVNILGAHEL